jgi:hypothetical protein
MTCLDTSGTGIALRQRKHLMGLFQWVAPRADDFWRDHVMAGKIQIRLIDEARTRRTVELLLVLWLLAMADLFFTIWAHLFTPFQELNPWASHLLHHNNLVALILFKVGLTGLGTMIFWGLRKHGRSEIALWLVVLVYVALAFRWHDYTTQVLALGFNQSL